jgi:hypothetical protein
MRKSQCVYLAVMCLVFVGGAGCRKPANNAQEDHPSNVKVEPVLQSDHSSLVFDIVPSKDPVTPSAAMYDCTYTARGRTARFRLQFVEGAVVDEKFQVSKAEGKFVTVAGSDDTALLEDLKTVLDARHLPKNTTKVPELAFDAVVLGRKQSRDASGALSSNPPGDWMATKIFLPKEGDEGEVFLNLNPVLGKGEFTLKDSDYGDYVLKELSKVL